MTKRALLTAVGLGPGDGELITVKGMRAIQAADLIFVPRSLGGEMSLAMRIAQPWVDPIRQQVVELALPMTKDMTRLAPAWRDGADQIAQRLFAVCSEPERLTAHAVYLLLGDPLLYGTFTYLHRELVERYPQITIDIVPGITSFAAAAARLQLTLGTTSERLAIVPASYITDECDAAIDLAALERLFAEFETVIFLKVGSVMPQLLAGLEQLGRLGDAVYAERVGMPEELIVHDVRSLRGQRRPYLSLLIVRSRA